MSPCRTTFEDPPPSSMSSCLSFLESQEEVRMKCPMTYPQRQPQRRPTWLPRLSRWWPCRTYKWIRDFVSAFLHLLLSEHWIDYVYTLALIAGFLCGCWAAIEGILHIVKGASAQNIDCSVAYVTIPGPIVTVSLIGQTPKDPDHGTYYYSVMNGTTRWFDSIEPPTRTSMPITSRVGGNPGSPGISSPSPSGPVPTSTVLPPGSFSAPHFTSAAPQPPPSSESRVISLSLSQTSSMAVTSPPTASTPLSRLSESPAVSSSPIESTTVPPGAIISLISTPISSGERFPSLDPQPVTITSTMTSSTWTSTIIATRPNGPDAQSSSRRPLSGTGLPILSPAIHGTSIVTHVQPSSSSRGDQVGTPTASISPSSLLVPPNDQPSDPNTSTRATSMGPIRTLPWPSSDGTRIPLSRSSGNTAAFSGGPSKTLSIVDGSSEISVSAPSNTHPGSTSSTTTHWTSSPARPTALSSRPPNLASPSDASSPLSLSTISMVVTLSQRTSISSSSSASKSSSPNFPSITRRTSTTTQSIQDGSSFLEPSTSSIGDSSRGMTSLSPTTVSKSTLTNTLMVSLSSTFSTTTTTIELVSNPPPPASISKSVVNFTSSTIFLNMSSSSSGGSPSVVTSSSLVASTLSSITQTISSPLSDTHPSASSRMSKTAHETSASLSSPQSSPSPVPIIISASASAETSTTGRQTSFMSGVNTGPTQSATSDMITKVLAYADSRFSLVFPRPDITTTHSYWTGTYPSITGPDWTDLPVTTRRDTTLQTIIGTKITFRDVSTATQTEGRMVARAAAEKPGPSSCGESGSFTLTFDDSTVSGGEGDVVVVNGMANPYHHLFYANGFSYLPDKWEPYAARSQPNVAIFMPLGGRLLPNSGFAGTLLPGEIGAGPRASVDAYWFNARSGYFGCALNGITACTLQIRGYRYDEAVNGEVVVAQQNVTIPPCWGYIGCQLTQVSFEEEFRGLSGIQFKAFTSGLGIPQMFMMDDVEMDWYNNSCSAGILRIGHS